MVVNIKTQDSISFFYEHDIKMERIVPGTPQHKNVAKFMNQTLTKRSKSLRMKSDLPKQLWVEVVNTTTYLINRGPSIPLEHKIS